jgi:hypothetical protein
MSILLWLLGVPLSVVVVLWLVHVIYAGSTSVPRNRPTAEPVLPLSTVLANSPRATRREAGRAEHPNLLARHLSTGPSRSPRMGAADPPRPGRQGRRIAVLFGQLCRLGLKPMRARFAPHDQPHLGRDGLAEGYQGHPGATSPAERALAALP